MAALVSKFLAGIRSGDFLDRARIRRFAVIYLIAIVVSFAALVATSDGFRDRMGRPLGTDFMAFHVAGSIALEDGAAAAYDPLKQYAEHQKRLEEAQPRFWPFLYPPAFLFVAMALASLPYLAAWLSWMAATGALYLATMRKIAPGGFAALLAIAFPAAYLNFLHGQNGFLLASLFGFGVWGLGKERSLLAGIAFGLVAIKPQYGVLIPIALAAGGHWRAFAAASATFAFLAVLPTLAFGADVWPAFFDTARAARREVIEAGAIGFEKIVSVFAQARFLGAPIAAAYGLQAAMLAALALFVWRLWRGNASNAMKGAGLIIASVLASPYAVDYDLVILAPALAFIVIEDLGRGFAPYEKSILLFAAVAPVIARPVGMATHLSVGLFAMLALLWIVRRRAMRIAVPPAAAA